MTVPVTVAVTVAATVAATLLATPSGDRVVEGEGMIRAVSASPEDAPAPSQASFPRPTDGRPVDFPGLHNVVAYHEGLLSGSAPEGAAAWDSLKVLGIRTIISVDGAIPDVVSARGQGIRYVHLPIGYDGFDDARKAELVRAVRDLPKPIYIHCHHGKHRSAGAAATIAVSLGWLRNDAAAERMRVSQTSDSYKGLWSCAAKAAPMMAAAIDAASGEFPEVTRPGSMVQAMVAIDEALERIRLVEKAGWRVPLDHPDLVPAADAGKLADLLRFLADDAHVARLEEEPRVSFRALLADGAANAVLLEQALVDLRVGATPAATGAGFGPTAGAERLKAALAAVAGNCKACHAKHRD